ncbi:response regulator [Sphingomonas prati]|uniref:DNA-binding response OmpR family regulator n=1 Tax=Sphingomonas prati TaxID=1843237 RepID=A0A7W9BVI7_9SPHN|nr:response regulator [Sphingomonas prati]MBB5730860.1 DNA-binding response OmpR family regulator [Sphingomonas prati]GGE97168.1 response regulator [Sphingomonas prati]
MPVTPADCRVLVVEDESAVLMLVEDMLIDLGYSKIDTAMSVSEALPIADTAELTFAILDVNLGGQRSSPIADRLRARGVPFVFATGYGSRGMDDAYVGSIVLRKPFRLGELEVAINRALAHLD